MPPGRSPAAVRAFFRKDVSWFGVPATAPAETLVQPRQRQAGKNQFRVPAMPCFQYGIERKTAMGQREHLIGPGAVCEFAIGRPRRDFKRCEQPGHGFPEAAAPAFRPDAVVTCDATPVAKPSRNAAGRCRRLSGNAGAAGRRVVANKAMSFSYSCWFRCRFRKSTHFRQPDNGGKFRQDLFIGRNQCVTGVSGGGRRRISDSSAAERPITSKEDRAADRD